MALNEEGCRVRVFITEKNQHEGIPLYQWLVNEALKQGIAGATVLRGIEGFGSAHHIHKAKIFERHTDLPIIVELIDNTEKIEKFISLTEPMIGSGTIITNTVQMKLYRQK
ncbi:MAG: DUF190 domain-containing protein, partial [Gammaproteobacteria bacterium]|nr:DUF190 domain-containing protein [Gammaproteobacteria bacterium]